MESLAYGSRGEALFDHRVASSRKGMKATFFVTLSSSFRMPNLQSKVPEPPRLAIRALRPWLGEVAPCPAVEMAFLYGEITRGVALTDASPQDAVVGSRVPILLIHGLADKNIPFQQSEWIRSHNTADITLWEVPGAGHCSAVSVIPQEFDNRVLGWFSAHDNPRGIA